MVIAKTEIILPAMGEGIIEATIMKWLFEPGDKVEKDEPLVEIATDKVDSELPSPASGVLERIIYREGEIPKVGEVIAVIGSGDDKVEAVKDDIIIKKSEEDNIIDNFINAEQSEGNKIAEPETDIISAKPGRYSPFIRNLAQQRETSLNELEQIQGSGANGRITRDDLYDYIRQGRPMRKPVHSEFTSGYGHTEVQKDEYMPNPGEVVTKMDRTRKLIAEHMVRSKRIAPHVTSMIEVDMTHLVEWRNAVKDEFKKKNGVPLTYTAIITEAVARSLKQFPAINVSVYNEQIIRKPNINIGIATALPDGNLIVPVIHKADHLNLTAIAQRIFDLSLRAREGKLEPQEITGGTFTITNMGQFGNITGTPIINQPEVAILAVGTIKKAPAVVDVNGEKTIGIRDIIVLSLTYDHRIVDGALGGSFLKSIGDNIDNFLLNFDQKS